MTAKMLRPWRRRVVVALAVLITIAITAPGRAAGPYEEPTSRPVAESLTPDLAAGPYHKVRDPIQADGYMLRFVVQSKFGNFEPTGIGALRKLVLRELPAIAELQKIKASSAFTKQVKDSATSPLQFAYKLMTHPVDTASGLPKGLYKGAEAVYTSATTERDPSADSRTATILLQSGKKREYAAKMGVDPYSSNAVLQKELNAVGWAAALGSWTVTVATAPISGVASTVITTTKFGDAVGDYLKTEGPADLRARNTKRLNEMGLPSALIDRFLDHKAYTPRHDTIITESLAGLDGVQGREAFLEAAVKAEDEVDANLYMATVQILRGYHLGVGKLTQIREMSGLLIAQSQGGPAIIAYPLDYGLWRQAGDQLSDQIKATYSAPGHNGNFEIWVTGTVSPRAKLGYAAKNITIVERANTRIEILD
jgi:hypothetical protein